MAVLTLHSHGTSREGGWGLGGVNREGSEGNEKVMIKVENIVGVKTEKRDLG